MGKPISCVTRAREPESRPTLSHITARVKHETDLDLRNVIQDLLTSAEIRSANFMS